MAERFVADEYTAATGRRVQGYTKMLRHQDAPLIGHVDRLVIPDGAKIASHRGEIRTDRLLECKTAHPMSLHGGDWGESGTDLVPPSYLVQCAAYLALTGCEVADLACLFGNQELRIYTIRRDLELESSLIEQTSDWWEAHVALDVPPDPATTDECRKLWPSHRLGKSLIVDLRIARDIDALSECKGEIKRIQAVADEIETRVLTAFGDAEELTYMGRKLATWKANKAGSKTDWKAVATDLAPLIDSEAYQLTVDSHTETKPGARVLRIAKQQEQ
jgi:predicted phage-related endonuclease